VAARREGRGKKDRCASYGGGRYWWRGRGKKKKRKIAQLHCYGDVEERRRESDPSRLEHQQGRDGADPIGEGEGKKVGPLAIGRDHIKGGEKEGPAMKLALRQGLRRPFEEGGGKKELSFYPRIRQGEREDRSRLYIS